MCELRHVGSGPVTSPRGLIERAGWTPGRRIDVGDALASLQTDEFDVVSVARGFLVEYSGLTITSQDGARALLIDGLTAARNSDPEWCAAYSSAIGMPVTPVGQYSHMVLLIDETGRFWGGFDSAYGFLGDDIDDVVRGLLVEPGSRQLDREC